MIGPRRTIALLSQRPNPQIELDLGRRASRSYARLAVDHADPCLQWIGLELEQRLVQRVHIGEERDIGLQQSGHRSLLAIGAVCDPKQTKERSGPSYSSASAGIRED